MLSYIDIILIIPFLWGTYKGFSVHTFELEAVLAIDVTKVIGSDTLSGNGTADLLKNETVSVKIKIK